MQRIQTTTKKGYAFEASQAYLKKVNEADKYENIIAMTKSNNQKSINLLLKLGLQYQKTRQKIYQTTHQNEQETVFYYSLKNEL